VEARLELRDAGNPDSLQQLLKTPGSTPTTRARISMTGGLKMIFDYWISVVDQHETETESFG
jgi:hypothetical protein